LIPTTLPVRTDVSEFMLSGKLTNSFLAASKPFVRKLHQRRSMQNLARTPQQRKPKA
jgi:hypothetical protein